MENENKEFDLYKDIGSRTGGEIYIGVVGPVRTGKSTFIKRFMDLFVLPNIADEHVRERTRDELPQSAAGKTIMTTEPKFIPQEAAKITLSDESEILVRLIDCVGFMVEGASGHLEGEESRMVKTPWFNEEIPFTDAAKTGTQKVIKDHSTIGVVVTTDGSIGELIRDNYIAAEETTVNELKKIGKPFIILLNTIQPYSAKTTELAANLEEKYKARVLPVNCQQMKQKDVITLLGELLYEFPVKRIDYNIPEWTKLLSLSHPVKAAITDAAKSSLLCIERIRDAKEVFAKELPLEEPIFSEISLTKADLSNGTLDVRIEVKSTHYFSYISEMTGADITNESQMIELLRTLSGKKKDYERVESALDAVEQKGYGVVMPGLSDIRMEDPSLISHGGKYGIKMRAISPSIHMIKADIETEIAPIVGSEAQANDLIEYIKASEAQGEGLFGTNIFGKTVGDLMEDGIRAKITQMDDECQMKLQDTMQKIVNDSRGGMVCIII